MEGTGRPRIRQPRVLAGARNRVVARRRLRFSHMANQGLFLTRADIFPLIPTPHIRNAPEYFRVVNNDAGGVGDAVEAEAVIRAEGNAPAPLRRRSRSSGTERVARRTHRKRRRNGVISSSRSPNPKVTNLKNTVKRCKTFVSQAVREARGISLERICASKKKNRLDSLLEKARRFLYTFARASQRQQLSEAEWRTFEKLETVNRNIEEIVHNFQEQMETYRKAARNHPERSSRKRICCEFCTEENA